MNSTLLTARFVLAFLLLSASAPKLADRRRFRRSVADYRLLPWWMVGPAAITISWIEVGSAVALLAGVAVTAVATVDGLLFLAFSGAVSLTLRRGRRIDCGCLGATARRRIGWDLVAIDLGCAVMAGLIAATSAWPSITSGSIAVPHPPMASGSSIASTLLAAVIVVAYLLILSWLEIRSAFAQLPAAVREELA